MATNIPFQQVKVSTGLRAPDITKAGGLISKALSGFASTIEGVGEQRVDDAQNVFQNELREANKSGDFSNVNFDSLNAVGANTQELQAAETALRNSQLDVLGRESEQEFSTRFNNNAVALNRAVSQFAETNPNLKDIVTVDNSGTLQFSADPNFTTTQINSAKDIIAKTLQAPDSGFTPLRNQREITSDLHQRVRALGGSSDQARQITSNFNEFRKGFSELNDEEKAIVSDLNEQTDIRYRQAQQRLSTIKQAKEIEFGFTTETATQTLQIQEKDIQDYIRQNLAEEQWFSTGGSDAQDDIRTLLTNKKTKQGTPIKPWMIMEALISTADPEEGHQTYLEGQFNDRLESIARDSTRIAQLREAALLDERHKEDLLTIEQQNLLARNGNLSQVKTQAGVRNPAFNRSIAERTITNELNTAGPQDSGVVTTPVPPQGTTILPDNDPGFLNTVTNIGGFVVDRAGATAEVLSQGADAVGDALGFTGPGIELSAAAEGQQLSGALIKRNENVLLNRARELERRFGLNPNSTKQEYDAQIKSAATQGNTQAKEYQILRAYLAGASIEDIAQALKIDRRFVNVVIGR